MQAAFSKPDIIDLEQVSINSVATRDELCHTVNDVACAYAIVRNVGITHEQALGAVREALKRLTMPEMDELELADQQFP